jgi:Na+-driven multidrug efflux pump
MGIAGAALATVIARCISLSFSLYILIFRDRMLTFKKPSLKELFENWKEIAFVGFPAALVQAINPLSLAVITRLLSQFGEPVVAGYGAAIRIEMLIIIIPNALATVMAPFAGQNWGAGNIERIKKAVKISSLISVAWGGIVSVFLLLGANSLLSLFNPNPTTIQAGASYLKIVGISYGFLGILLIASQSFNGINKPLHSACVSVIKAFIINVPLALLGMSLLQEDGIFYATFLTNIISGIIALFFLYHVLNKHMKEISLFSNHCELI